MMPAMELLTRSALYLASGYALCLLSWVIADRMLPLSKMCINLYTA